MNYLEFEKIIKNIGFEKSLKNIKSMNYGNYYIYGDYKINISLYKDFYSLIYEHTVILQDSFENNLELIEMFKKELRSNKLKNILNNRY